MSKELYYTSWSKKVWSYGTSGFLLLLLLLFEVSMHPLGFGPDRRIHDPAVYRQAETSYMTGDWYTQMALESKVYIFYAELVNAGEHLGVSGELWRSLLYISCLAGTYLALLAIARLFTRHWLAVPLVALFHALLMLIAPPIWLYGPFIHIDGGLAPRSVGMMFSFVALFFLLTKPRILPWAFLGIATLIHVSNSLIVFTLFLGAWTVKEILQRWKEGFQVIKDVFQRIGVAIVTYLLTGGWFAALVGLTDKGVATFSDTQFIWTWIYFRAPYMALPLIRWEAWLLFFLHMLALLISWGILWHWKKEKYREKLLLLGLIGIGGVVYFFLFYFFAFIWPWLPGFQFYSLRVVYFTHFVVYLFSALVLIEAGRRFILSPHLLSVKSKKALVAGATVIIIISGLCFTFPGQKYQNQAFKNIIASWNYLTNPEARHIIPTTPLAMELAIREEPFLAPVNWSGSSSYYLPHVASFKTFGFTPRGLEEWFRRMNDLSHGELETAYRVQRETGVFQPVTINWNDHYLRLTEEEVRVLSQKYQFSLFVTFQKNKYPFEIIAEDADYVLYRIR